MTQRQVASIHVFDSEGVLFGSIRWLDELDPERLLAIAEVLKDAGDHAVQAITGLADQRFEDELADEELLDETDEEPGS